ncbi:MAG: aminotransferase [Deltaproteobacteria bacterium]|nr:MAG: aminotransferase [Deltaproteobacteria bacterium]
MLHKEKFLLIPGPTEVSPDVLAVMGAPLMAHYMDDFMKLYNETIDMLKKLLQTRSDVYILTGSGSSALEAAICSLIEPGDKVIVDDFLKEFVKTYGGEPIELSVPFGKPIDPAEVERKLEKEKDVKAIAVIHNITFSGVTNPIEEIGKIAYDHGVFFIIDAISSLGGIEIKTDEWHVDIVCSAGQKALAVPAGIAPISVSQRALEAMKNRKEPIRSLYLNLLRYEKPPIDPEKKWHPTPSTCSTVLIRALWKSLKNIMEEGIENCFRRHAIAAKAMREGLKAMGLELLVKDERYASNTVTAVEWPKGYDYPKFWRTLYDDYNIMIGNPPEHQPKGIEKAIFRVAHMGNTATMPCVLMGLAYIEKALNKVGFKTKGGEGVAAAQRIFLETL